MTHSIEYNPETGIVEIKFQGIVTLNEMKEFLSETKSILVEKGSFLILSDFLEAKLSLSTIEIYNLPKTVSDEIAPLDISVHKLKRAVVISKGSEDFAFGETVMSNRGQNLKIFHNGDEAKAWLLNK